MNYQNRVKSRILKRNLVRIFELVQFKGLHLRNSQKTIIAGCLITFVSLFFTWIASPEKGISGNAFYNLVGNTGWLLLIILLFLCFIIFSERRKEKLKLGANLHFSDDNVSIIGGIGIVLLSFNALSYIIGLQSFSSDILYGNGIVVSIIGGIIIIGGGILLKHDINNHKHQRIFSNYASNESSTPQEKERANMKLPF